MLTPNGKPIDVDMEILTMQLLALRDALIEASLALQDYQFALDSAGQRGAECEARQWIKHAQGGGNRDNAVLGSVDPPIST